MTIPDLIPLTNRLAALVTAKDVDWLEVYKQAELIRNLAAAISQHAERQAAEQF